MSAQMVVTWRRTTRRERRRLEFSRWWHKFASDDAKLEHLMNCAEGCVGCRSIPGLFTDDYRRRMR